LVGCSLAVLPPPSCLLLCCCCCRRSTYPPLLFSLGVLHAARRALARRVPRDSYTAAALVEEIKRIQTSRAAEPRGRFARRRSTDSFLPPHPSAQHPVPADTPLSLVHDKGRPECRPTWRRRATPPAGAEAQAVPLRPAFGRRVVRRGGPEHVAGVAAWRRGRRAGPGPASRLSVPGRQAGAVPSGEQIRHRLSSAAAATASSTPRSTHRHLPDQPLNRPACPETYQFESSAGCRSLV
jgi:hypothetical protein